MQLSDSFGKALLKLPGSYALVSRPSTGVARAALSGEQSLLSFGSVGNGKGYLCASQFSDLTRELLASSYAECLKGVSGDLYSGGSHTYLAPSIGLKIRYQSDGENVTDWVGVGSRLPQANFNDGPGNSLSEDPNGVVDFGSKGRYEALQDLIADVNECCGYDLCYGADDAQRMIFIKGCFTKADLLKALSEAIASYPIVEPYRGQSQSLHQLLVRLAKSCGNGTLRDLYLAVLSGQTAQTTLGFLQNQGYMTSTDVPPTTSVEVEGVELGFTLGTGNFRIDGTTGMPTGQNLVVSP